MKMRWYHSLPLEQYKHFPSTFQTFFSLTTRTLIKYAHQPFEDLEMEPFSTILKIYAGVYTLITEFCQVIRKYLAIYEDDPYLLLSEYTSRWNLYVASMMELSTTLKSMESRINQLYRIFFSGHPQNPKFTIWRLMVV